MNLRDAFGLALVQLAPKYDFWVFDCDVANGTGTHHFKKAYPERFIQCGLMEQHMMCAAAGFALESGLPVFATTFAVFALRGIEQARLSIAYANANVKVVASHPGLDVGPDGASAQCLEDIAAWRSIPGMTVVSPSDTKNMNEACEEILKYGGPVYMRSGRSKTTAVNGSAFRLGKGEYLPGYGSDVTLVACGVMVSRAIKAAEMLSKEGIQATVLNMSTIKPIDGAKLYDCAKATGCFVTCEDHNIHGGLGSAVAEELAQTYPVPIEMVGINDTFGESGTPEELPQKYGISEEHIVSAAKDVIWRKNEGIVGV